MIEQHLHLTCATQYRMAHSNVSGITKRYLRPLRLPGWPGSPPDDRKACAAQSMRFLALLVTRCPIDPVLTHRKPVDKEFDRVACREWDRGKGRTIPDEQAFTAVAFLGPRRPGSPPTASFGSSDPATTPTTRTHFQVQRADAGTNDALPNCPQSRTAPWSGRSHDPAKYIVTTSQWHGLTHKQRTVHT